MLKKFRSREGVIRQAILNLAYVTAGVLVVVDLVAPDLRVGRLGMFIMLIAVMATVVRRINRSVGPVYEAGRRSGRRHAELEAAELQTLSVVRDAAPR